MSYNDDMRRLSGKGKGPSPRILLRVSEEMRQALERLAAEDRRSLSDYVRLALEDHVEARRRKGVK